MKKYLKYGLSCIFCINLILPSFAQNLKWYNPATEKVSVIQGRGWDEKIGVNYQRLPFYAKDKVRPQVWNLSMQTAGLYLKFYSDAPSITVKYVPTMVRSMAHMPLTGSRGVDLYAKDKDGNYYFCARNFNFGDTVTYNFYGISYHNALEKGYEYTLYLPLYDGVKTMEIGVPVESYFEFIPTSADLKKPVVVYGTSIAQGGCSSRPGMAWSNILHRKINRSVINLGFSGNGRLEEPVFKLLSEIDASVFVIDCMPNMQGTLMPLIEERLIKGIEILRSKTDVPILLVEHDGYMSYHVCDSRKTGFEKSNEHLQRAYKVLKKKYKDIYFLSLDELGLEMDSQVDGVHATDLGMSQYATAYAKKITKILKHTK